MVLKEFLTGLVKYILPVLILIISIFIYPNFLWLIIGLVWIMIDLFLVIMTMKGDDKNTMA
ncbi:MAG: hypothetical protein AAE985_05825 [Thermoplasmataceae archaeon]|jgi:EamA domain-containing membrane protein RarD|nr:hypothetical protein [Candidatus Thermoplasmatota archaeon]MCL5787698.1 hypothetical protein [Candidatus Thermoplasmatota archaeon]